MAEERRAKGSVHIVYTSPVRRDGSGLLHGPQTPCPIPWRRVSSAFAGNYGGTSVLNRGDRREPIFKDDDDRSLFLDALAEACAKTGWQVHACCLMHNHALHLQSRRKGDKDKVAIAARLRRETTMSLKWLAARLVMGSWTNVANLLAARRRAKR